jgi:hypothetical protein
LENSKNSGHRENFLEDFYPIKILPWDISSNIGLAQSFATLLEIGKKSIFSSKSILNIKNLDF